jgi:hypothetical protein
MAAPRWPDRYVTTAMVTPIQFNDDPYSALIFYDWSGTGTQLILPFQGQPLTLQGIISLKKNVGYRLRLPPKGNGVCAPVLPGLVKPDWMTLASCECQGVIEHNATFGPAADSQILSCPIKAQGQRLLGKLMRSRVVGASARSPACRTEFAAQKSRSADKLVSLTGVKTGK